ncbi:MAG: peptide chain release factor 2 [Parcubacteria group bacterium]|nr:peptide chain release factor 2 [Parcubacteria group bacterium]
MEAETTLEDFWKDRLHSQKVSRDLADLKDLTEKWENYQNDLKHLAEVAEIFEDLAGQEQLFKEFKRSLEKLETELEKEETLVYLSGRYDKNNAIITIYSGAGGTDAQEWVEMLLRMYLRYSEKAGFKPQVVAVTSGGEAGLKNAIMEIRGRYAYGYLKRENGVHRLVRISPFSSQNLRHTSFALVEVLPELDDVSAIEIKPEDIKVDTYKAGGPGGQYVNKTESAIRITHLPTGLVTTSQAERSQGSNKDKALKMLYAKIQQRLEQEHKKTVDELKGAAVSIEWGHQIRSYVLNPYKMVKDHRTGYETTQAEDVLAGNLKDFIEAELKLV